MTLIFNHIPKTGGITFRGILYKVYKPNDVFFIDSLNVAASVSTLKNMAKPELLRLKVIAGHGAGFITEIIDKPFRTTILREPVSLFISQYNFLKTDPGTIFFDEVKALGNIESYLEYAVKKGQDNLLTRYLSGSMGWLINPEIPINDMEKEGKHLLEKAKMNLLKYNAVLDLKTFDAGVFALSQKLGWKKIPIYRPHNISKARKSNIVFDSGFEAQLKHALRFDVALYNYFLDANLDIAKQAPSNQFLFKIFIFRQKILNLMSRFTPS